MNKSALVMDTPKTVTIAHSELSTAAILNMRDVVS